MTLGAVLGVHDRVPRRPQGALAATSVTEIVVSGRSDGFISARAVFIPAKAPDNRVQFANCEVHVWLNLIIFRPWEDDIVRTCTNMKISTPSMREAHF